jgi:hypothetical protein
MYTVCRCVRFDGSHFEDTLGFINIICIIIHSYCHVSQWLRRGFGLVIGFINNLQVPTTTNYYTIGALHNVQSLHTNLFSLSALVFTGL